MRAAAIAMKKSEEGRIRVAVCACVGSLLLIFSRHSSRKVRYSFVPLMNKYRREWCCRESSSELSSAQFAGNCRGHGSPNPGIKRSPRLLTPAIQSRCTHPITPPQSLLRPTTMTLVVRPTSLSLTNHPSRTTTRRSTTPTHGTLLPTRAFRHGRCRIPDRPPLRHTPSTILQPLQMNASGRLPLTTT